ncbi:YD repeat-containing protein, partial [Apibacter mensalis]
MLLTDNHFTPVLGIDIHFTTLPPFNPFHPYIGIVMDPMDYVPFVGATVQINGQKRGVSDTNGIILTLKHIPLFTPPWVMTPIIGHQSMNFFASKNVYAESTRLSPKGHMLMTCNDIGIPLSLQPGKKKFWKLTPTLFAPTSYSLPISFGPKVNVGGPYPPDWGGILSGLAMSFGFGAIMKGLGKGLKKTKNLITKFNHNLKAKKGPNKLSNVLCQLGFEPVNLVSGAVVYEGTDFSLPGIIPLEWKRAWYSDSDYLGPLGHGVHANYDLDIEVFPEEKVILVRVEDGRIIEFPLLEKDEDFYLREEKMTLLRKKNGFEVFFHSNQETYFYEHRISQVHYKLSKIQNSAGFFLQFKYSFGILSEIIDTAQRKIRIYNNEKKITRIALVREDINTEETLVEYQYDGNDNMNAITDSRNQTTRIQYKGYLMVKKTDRNGQSFYWKYNGDAVGAKCIHTWGDGGLQEGSIEYYPQKGYNCVTDSQGAKTLYYYTPEQLVTQIQDPLGNARFFHYTEFMELYREIDEEGNCTGYSYDERGNQTAITYADGSQQIFMYDKKDRLSLVISPEGHKKSYVYKKQSSLLHAIIEPDDRYTVFHYNEKNLLSEISHNGNSLFLEYDQQHNLISLSDKNKQTTEWSYDFRGNVTRIKNAQGINQHFRYDELSRVISVRCEDQETHFRYNAYEEIIEALEGNKKVSFQYTPLGSLIMREQNGKKVQFSYDKMERIKEVRNAKNEIYQFIRNPRGDINR